MAITAFPFDSQSITETQYSKFFRQIIGTGVLGTPGDTALQVTSPASGMLVNVAAGAAVIRGHYIESDAVAPLTLTNGATSPRTDLIVLRLNPATNSIGMVIVEGTPGASAPALTQTDTGVYELALAQIVVPANATAIGNSNITDLRTYSGQGSLSNHKLASMVQATVKGRAAGTGTGTPGDLTAADLKAILLLAATDIAGFTEAAQDAVLAVLTDSAELDWSYNDAGNSASAVLVSGSIADSKLASMAQGTIKGRAAGAGSGAPTALTPTEAKAILAIGVADVAGAARQVEIAQTLTAVTITDGIRFTVPEPATATMFRAVLTANATFVFPTVAAGKRLWIEAKQDTSGTRTITWPANVKWPGNAAPTPTAAASRSDIFAFACVDGVNWIGAVAGQNYQL